jgi:hypothetical protein
MGTWTLESATPTIRDRNDVYGHIFAIKFRLKYTTSAVGPFAEMPRLEWKETITMAEPNAKTWWQYVGDQYQRNAGSPTFMAWTSRYVNAYFCVAKQKYEPDALTCLYDVQGQKLPSATLPQASSPKEQADAVRTYLKASGGILEVTVVDTPGIKKPEKPKPGQPAVLKDRLLLFDCGLRGMGKRTTAYQRLTVDGAKSEAQWFRECRVATGSPPLSTTGFAKVNPPPDVSVVKPFAANPQSGIYE